MRVHTDITPKSGKFEVVSDFEPSGDQPAAIEELERAAARGGARRRAARRHRHGQVGHRGVADRAAAAADPDHGARTRRSPRSWPTSCARCCRTTPSSTSSATTTTTSPRRTSRRPTPTSRRTARSTTRSSGCGTRPPTRCSPAATSWWWPPCRASTASARRRSTSTGRCGCTWASRSSASTILRHLVDVQYSRNDLSFTRGTFRVRGDTVEIFPVYEELAIRVEMFGDEIERLYYLHPLTGEVVREVDEVFVFPATHYAAGPERMERAIRGIEKELERAAGRARGPEQAARGAAAAHAHGLRHRDDAPGRLLLRASRTTRCTSTAGEPGSAPNCLLDYFPEDFLLVIDESHVTVPQTGGMYEGDMSRKRMLVDHGFRLPSAMDNRPLKFEEFTERIGQTVYLSATPGNYELGRTKGEFVEQVIRPTGLVDPEIVVKPTKGQIDDLLARDPRARRAQRAGAGHDADQEDGRGPHRLPARAGRAGALPALRGRHAAPGRAAARAADGRVRRAGRHQPAARGARPARGVAGGDPRRRQGGLPALGHVADPDDRPRRAQRVGPGAHVRRHRHAVDAQRPSTRPTAAARSRWPTTASTASTRSRCASGSPTSPTCSPARPRTPTSCSARTPVGGSGRSQSRGKSAGAGPRRPRRVGGGRSVVSSASGRTPAAAWTSPRCPAPSSPTSSSSSTSRCCGAARELQFEVAARLRDEIGELKKELRGMDAAGVGR